MRCVDDGLQTKVNADCQVPENRKRQQGAGGTEQDTETYYKRGVTNCQGEKREQ